MAESPKKVPQRLNKDVREVIKEMSKAPFGRPGKVNKTPMLTVAETEEIKAKAKVPPILEIKKEPLKLTPKQKEARIKEISKERGISYSKAKEVLRKELSRAPESVSKQQPLEYKKTEKVSGGNEGKGTPTGDAKDIKMRSVANFAIVELEDTKRQSLSVMSNIIEASKSSSETTLREVGPVTKDADLRGKTIMLARNGKLSGKPLRPETIDQITKAVKAGARFVVGDMPGVDSKFVNLLNQLKADYTVYHTGDKPRFAQEEVVTSRKPTLVKQPEFIAGKAIPTRQEVEDVSTRAVKYKGKTIYLTPGQIKQLGLPVDYPKTTFGNLFGEDKAQAKKAEDLLNREIKDVKSIKESNMLREEAAKDWSNQARAAATNPQVRDPLEALGKATPDSAKAESYAERLYQKAYKELSIQERKRIKIIIEEDARRAAKATQSTVGREMDVKGIKRGSYVPPFIKSPGGLGALGFVGFAANAFFSYKLMLQEAEQENKNLREQAMN